MFVHYGFMAHIIFADRVELLFRVSFPDATSFTKMKVQVPVDRDDLITFSFLF